ncbi:MAG: 1-(5-phosphoribosyl)-5-[(5-phosphoribosylamino)methylideneamino] imidazole-4-carboxamide isomerase [Candidatus Limnocylindrales bacterium]
MSASAPSTFDLLPAIDLRGGMVVRLTQGDFDREQVYAADPVRVAVDFVAAGAPWIHVVDLDGARSGGRRQRETIEAIVAAVGQRDPGVRRAHTVQVQVAGGLRDAGAIADALAAGASRVVLGTAAITNPDLVADAVSDHGADRIAVALDVRDGLAVGQGWVSGAPATAVEAAIERLTGCGVATFVVTAIARDGLLGGPDLELLERAIGLTDGAVIASGGIASIADLDAVRAIGCHGAIVGRAIYDGRIDLAEAIGRGQVRRSTG